MPLVNSGGGALPARCPDRERGEDGRGCRHMVNRRTCARDAHPVCEEYLRKNPDWRPMDDPRLSNTVVGLRAQRALDSQEGDRYRRMVAAGTWFRDPEWRDRGAGLVQIGLRTGAADAEADETDAERKEAMVELARKMPDRITLSRLGKFRRYPVRKSRTNHECAVCHLEIGPGDRYHDGGSPSLRAHQACVADAPIEIAMVGAPTLEDVDDLERAGKHIMIETPTMGALWIVPELTRQDRKEITFRHWHTMCSMAMAFPGSRFTRVVRPGKEQIDCPGDPVEVRCTCHPEGRDTACPVRAKLGEDHPLATRVLLECECEPGWSVERQRKECPLGRAFGGHSLPEREDGDE